MINTKVRKLPPYAQAVSDDPLYQEAVKKYSSVFRIGTRSREYLDPSPTGILVASILCCKMNIAECESFLRHPECLHHKEGHFHSESRLRLRLELLKTKLVGLTNELVSSNLPSDFVESA